MVVAVLSFSVFQPITVLPRIHLSPGYSLANQSGERRTSEDYRGVVALYGIFYTRQDAQGIEMMEKMQALRERLASRPLKGSTSH